MTWIVVAFTLVERFGFSLVLITFLSLGMAYHPLTAQDPAGLVLQVGALGLGAIAIWTAYSVVRAALPDCGLMALATSAFLSVLPGHVTALSSHVLLGVAEAGFGLVLLSLVRMARSAALQRQYAVAGHGPAAGADVQERPVRWRAGMFLDLGFWAGITLAAAPGAVAVIPLLPVTLVAVGRKAGLRGTRLLSEAGRGSFIAGAAAFAVAGTVVLMARWLGASPTVPSDLATASSGVLGSFPAAIYSFRGFWLPASWETSSYVTIVQWVLAIVSLMGLVGAGWYGVSVAQRQAGLDEAERAAFGVFYLAFGLALLSASVVVARGAAPGPGLLYPFLTPLALLGLIGFESWFPPLTRPLFVFALLVGLFALNLYGLVTLP